MKAPKRPHAHRYISPEAKKLLQRLTAPRATLTYDTDTELWHFNRVENLSRSETKGAKEILHLALLETALRNGSQIHYRLTREANTVLLDPDYMPALMRAKCRPPAA